MNRVEETVERWIDELLTARRADCDCAPYRKPCSTCDAYWDGLLEMALRLVPEAFPPASNGSSAPQR